MIEIAKYPLLFKTKTLTEISLSTKVWSSCKFIWKPPSPEIHIILFFSDLAHAAPIAPGKPNPMELKELDVSKRFLPLFLNACIVHVKLVPMSVTIISSPVMEADNNSMKSYESIKFFDVIFGSLVIASFIFVLIVASFHCSWCPKALNWVDI